MKWIIAICGLLGVNVIAQVALAIAANNGGTQVIPAYYEKAAHYDDALEQAQKNHELGWHVQVALDRSTVQVVVRDPSGAPIDGAHVTVDGYQRAHAANELAVELIAVGAGTYRAAMPSRPGVHDLTITVENHGALFTQHAAVEVGERAQPSARGARPRASE